MLQWFAEVKEPPPWPVVASVGERGGAGGVAGVEAWWPGWREFTKVKSDY